MRTLMPGLEEQNLILW